MILWIEWLHNALTTANICTMPIISPQRAHIDYSNNVCFMPLNREHKKEKWTNDGSLYSIAYSRATWCRNYRKRNGIRAVLKAVRFPDRSAKIIRNVGVTEPGSLSPARVTATSACLRRGTVWLPQEQIWHHFSRAVGCTWGVEREQLTRGDAGRADWPDCSAGQATGKEGPRRGCGRGEGTDGR